MLNNDCPYCTAAYRSLIMVTVHMLDEANAEPSEELKNEVERISNKVLVAISDWIMAKIHCGDEFSFEEAFNRVE